MVNRSPQATDDHVTLLRNAGVVRIEMSMLPNKPRKDHGSHCQDLSDCSMTPEQFDEDKLDKDE